MTDSRLNLDTLFMMQALLMAERGTCTRAKVGAVITLARRSISSGYVGSPPGEPHCIEVGCLMENDHCVRTIHAEANAIAYGARSGVKLDGATLYTTLAPCRTCWRLALSAGIERVMYLKPYRENELSYPSSVLKVEQLIVKPFTHPFISLEREKACSFCGEPQWSHT